jgi:phosphoribosyl 1,2-cyclic phosphodiesterase
MHHKLTINTMTITFWGVRGSFPQCSRPYLGIGGHTSCVGVETRSGLFIFDAGTGIIDLGDWIKDTPLKSATCLITHPHMDHICGLPFFQPIHDKDFNLKLYSACMKPHGGIEKVISTVVSPPYFPVPWDQIQSKRVCEDGEPGETITIKDATISSINLKHPGGSCGYRLNYNGRSVAYITDTGHTPSELDKALTQFCERVDLLIYDAAFTEEEFAEKGHYGHSTWEHAVALAKAACVKELALFHHNPYHNDLQMNMIESQAQNHFSQTFVARQGMIRILS